MRGTNFQTLTTRLAVGRSDLICAFHSLIPLKPHQPGTSGHQSPGRHAGMMGNRDGWPLVPSFNGCLNKDLKQG